MESTGSIALTDEDVVLLRLVAAGASPTAIARRLALSERTVRRRLASICQRLGVAHSIEAVVLAVRQGLM